jgi:hypothetical protein
MLGAEVVATSTSSVESGSRALPVEPRRPSVAEQARAKGTPPIGDGSAYVDHELFAEPGELEEFQAFVRESRRAGVA